MPNGEHLVLRTPWTVVLVNVAPVVVVLFVAFINDPWLWGLAFISVGAVAAAYTHRRQYRTVLTPEGLVIRWFHTQLVPWNHIGAVTRSSSFGTGLVTIWDLTENRTRWLSSPRSFHRLGSADVAAAQALVDQWWIANRGPAPAVNPAARTPPGAAGR